MRKKIRQDKMKRKFQKEGNLMILLLGKNDAVKRYAKEILNIDMDNDSVYYPDEMTHYTELSQWVELAKEEEPYVVTTQRLDMIDAFLHKPGRNHGELPAIFLRRLS